VAEVSRQLTPVAWKHVTVDGGFWGPRVRTNRRVTLPHIYRQLRDTGRVDAWRMRWRPGMPNPPHVFWDSDVAKWLEGAAYALFAEPDAALATQVAELVELIVAAQQPDGYLNTPFTLVEPEKRWTNLRDQHELYCAGHLIEAAVALHEATGESRLLDALCRYADLIGTVFGAGDGQRRGYPGHEEIELALVRLWRATRQPRYLELARYFVDERGRTPHYFEQEAAARGETPQHQRHAYDQAHVPVREQTDAVGHAVRAMYLYCAMADLVAETGDETLWEACRRLWASVTERRMYVTGGIGSTAEGEAFTRDYDLPDTTAYAETCAAIGLVFWAHRMLQVEPDARYADIMEQALYNGVLSGVSLDGTSFFYTNPLAVDAERSGVRRSGWFDCACCPTNIARLLASLGGYVYATGKAGIHVHLYIVGSAEVPFRGQTVRLVQETAYPWQGAVRFIVEPEQAAEFGLCFRRPGWVGGFDVHVNGQSPLDPLPVEKGYVIIHRRWESGDVVELELPLPVERVRAHPNVVSARGRVALRRGPLVYCIEQADNGPDLDAITLPPEAAVEARHEPGVLGGVAVLEAERASLRAVPYFAWANREPGEMRVWIRQGRS